MLERARELDLPDWYVTAGAVYQTVWNGLTGRPPAAGIRDYDLSYHDPSDLSWEAEDAVIRGAASVFDADVEVRNQARVHLWYEDKWGVTCPPHASTEAAIATFPATAACIGVRLEADGGLHLHTAYGTEDLLALVVRPNRVPSPRARSTRRRSRGGLRSGRSSSSCRGEAPAPATLQTALGGVREWLNRAVSKTVVPVTPVPRVRIPPPPLYAIAAISSPAATTPATVRTWLPAVHSATHDGQRAAASALSGSSPASSWLRGTLYARVTAISPSR